MRRDGPAAPPAAGRRARREITPNTIAPRNASSNASTAARCRAARASVRSAARPITSDHERRAEHAHETGSSSGRASGMEPDDRPRRARRGIGAGVDPASTRGWGQSDTVPCGRTTTRPRCGRLPSPAMTAIQVQRTAQVLRRRRGRARHRPRGPPRRDPRAARPERRRQDHDRRDPRGLPPGDRRRRSRVLGDDPGRGDRALRDRIGIVLQESRSRSSTSPSASASRSTPATTRAPRDVDDTIALVGLDEQADQRGDAALRRAAPAPGRRARPRSATPS